MRLWTGKIAGNFLGTTFSVHFSSLGKEIKDHNFQNFLVLCSPCYLSSVCCPLLSESPSKYCPVQYFHRGLTWLELNNFPHHFGGWGKKHSLQKNNMWSLMNGAVSVCCFYSTSQTLCHCFVFSAVFLLGSSFLQDEKGWMSFPLGFTETVFTV